MCTVKLAAKIMRAQMGYHDNKRIRKQHSAGGVTVQEFRYVDDGDEMHLLNLYRPEGNDGKLPLVFDIHGGAWVYGDKELNRLYCEYLAARGVAVVGMSYRLLPDTDLVGQVADVFAAAEFVRAHAEEWGVDCDCVMLTGDSAGAHLSVLSYCVGQNPALGKLYGVGELPLGVKCMVLSHGVCEVHKLLLDKNGTPVGAATGAQRLMDKMMFGKRARRSPFYGKSALSEVEGGVEFPPVMVIGCDRDIYLQHTLILRDFFAKRAPQFLFHFVEGEAGRRLGHVYNIMRPEWEESRTVNDLSLRFFLGCADDGGYADDGGHADDGE